MAHLESSGPDTTITTNFKMMANKPKKNHMGPKTPRGNNKEHVVRSHITGIRALRMPIVPFRAFYYMEANTGLRRRNPQRSFKSISEQSNDGSPSMKLPN